MDNSRYDLTKLPAEELKNLLENHVDTITITIGNEENEFDLFYGGITWEFADQEDVDFTTILFEEDRDISKKQELREFAEILHLGHRPFNEDSDPLKFLVLLSHKEYTRLTNEIVPTVFGMLEEALDEEEREALREEEREELDEEEREALDEESDSEGGKKKD